MASLMRFLAAGDFDSGLAAGAVGAQVSATPAKAAALRKSRRGNFIIEFHIQPWGHV